MPGGDALAALLGRSLGDTLDDVSRHQFPAAGGSSAALSAAFAAALIAKSARGARSSWDGSGGAIAQAEALRTRLSALATTDADAYSRARDLLRRAGQDREHRGVAQAPGIAAVDAQQRDLDLAEALEVAAAAPMAIAEAAAEAAALAADVAAACGADERPDAVVATLLAEAAARGASELVLINLAIREHDDWAGRARDAATSAASSRARVLAGA
jgi:formiminotetrahydrofolate cyclodeaminase